MSNLYNDAFMQGLVDQVWELLEGKEGKAKEIIGNLKANHAFRHACRTLIHYLQIKCVELECISWSPKKSKEGRLFHASQNISIGLAHLKAIIRWLTNEKQNHGTLNNILKAAKEMDDRVSVLVLLL
jgi:hypothetical protein